MRQPLPPHQSPPLSFRERRKMENWFDIADIDYLSLLENMDFKSFLSKDCQMLDVGCGTGRFPALLLSEHPINSDLKIDYDMLDPSSYCLEECRKNLSPPFQAGKAFASTLDTSPLPEGQYDLIWAVHSLYQTDKASVDIALNKLSKALKPGEGIGVIYIADPESFYCRLSNQLCSLEDGHTLSPMLSSQDIVDALKKEKIMHKQRHIQFEHTLESNDPGLLHKYLIKNAGTQVSESALSDPAMEPFLKQFERQSRYIFPQSVSLILFGEKNLTLT